MGMKPDANHPRHVESRRWRLRMAAVLKTPGRLSRSLLPVFIAIISMSHVTARQASTSPASAEPTEVTVGTYVNQIYAMNLKENVFTVDFYIWFRWKGDAVNPIETFELTNGRIEERKTIPTRDVGGHHYAQARITAVINKFWDVSRFPLDNHDLSILIEDQNNDTNQVRYVADTQNAGFNKNLKILGYHVSDGGSSITDHHYNTNYGDISLPVGNESSYSRYGYYIHAERSGYGYFLKLFSTIFISAMVGFLAFLVKPVHVDPRFGLGVGALFAVVASTFIIASELPDSDGMTMADHINVASMIMIFTSLIQSAISLKIYESSVKGRLIVKRMDSICFVTFPTAYCLWILSIVLNR